MSQISEILRRSGSDKATGHSYDVVYAPLFEKHRQSAKAILEIGVYKGGSMHAWREIFPNALIVGVDKAPHKDLRPIPGKTVIIKTDATQRGCLPHIAKLAPFDIIIDDGSHQPADQQATRDLLMGYLKPGGLYVIEDVKTHAIALNLAKRYKGFIVDLRPVKNKHDDILVIYEKR